MADKKTITIPIVTGSYAVWLGKDAGKWPFKWNMYVRSVGEIDLSPLIKQVEFRLHESFPRPIRWRNEMPYEIEAHGFMNCEVVIIFHFRVHTGKRTQIVHVVELPDEDLTIGRPLVCEHYEEIVLINPSEKTKSVVSELKSGTVQMTKYPEVAELFDSKPLRHVEKEVEDIMVARERVESYAEERRKHLEELEREKNALERLISELQDTENEKDGKN